MIQPLADRIVVKAVETPEVSKGGIYLPETAKEKPGEGTVVAVGKGKTNENGEFVALDVKVGDKILFAKFAGVPIAIEDVDYLIMKEEELFAIV